MSETIPGGIYLRDNQLVDSEGKPIDPKNLEGVHGRFLSGVPDDKIASLRLSGEQKQQIAAERQRKLDEAELEQAPTQLAELGKMLEKASRVVPARAQPAAQSASGVNLGATTQEITTAFERSGKRETGK